MDIFANQQFPLFFCAMWCGIGICILDDNSDKYWLERVFGRISYIIFVWTMPHTPHCTPRMGLKQFDNMTESSPFSFFYGLAQQNNRASW